MTTANWPLRIASAALFCWAAGNAWSADHSAGDPFGSMQWPALRNQYLPNAPVVFDPRVKVTAPKFAEDSMNVPVAVNADALPDVVQVMVLVDRNPIHQVLEFFPLKARSSLSFRFKLEQGSPVRAAARTRDGVWHVGGTLVDAAGGGCTVPGATRADGSWSRTLNQVDARMFSSPATPEAARLKLRIMHPMDTGLAAGIPAFYIQHLTLSDQAGTEYMQLKLYEPVSENPVFSFDLPGQPQGALRLTGVDNNGNRIAAKVAP
jgi:sulfur-oxidizing protein SoxY